MTEKLLIDDIAERCKIFDENYAEVTERIAIAAKKSGRRAEDIHLLAATKTIPVEVINHAIKSGVTLIGENRVQELLSKLDYYDQSATRHLIGHLQTNKVRQIVGKVSMIESVDSIRLATEISRRSEELGIVTDILVEINIGGEESKSGIKPDDAEAIITEISSLSGVKVEGLMTIPPICEKIEENLRLLQKSHPSYYENNISINTVMAPPVDLISISEFFKAKKLDKVNYINLMETEYFKTNYVKSGQVNANPTLLNALMKSSYMGTLKK